LNKIWHNFCFTCGAGDKDGQGCKRTLKRDGYVDHSDSPFCNPCYDKLFKVKGYGYSNTLSTYDKTVDSSSTNTQKESTTATVSVAAAASVFNKSVATAATTSTTSAVAPKKGFVPTENPKCCVCAKSVFFKEELKAIGRIYHVSCFTCGGGKSDTQGCKKTLKRDGYLDHDSQPYCNACYGKLFKPKGFGSTLSTFPTVVEQGVDKVIDDVDNKPKVIDPVPVVALNSVTEVERKQPEVSAPVETKRPSIAAKEVESDVTIASESSKSASGATTRPSIRKSIDQLYLEASYSGNNDEVDETEW
jgi:hypothetical protein